MNQQEQLIQLRQTIIAHFNKAELRLLCADLGVNDESLSGDTIEERALSLVQLMGRRDRIPGLIAAIEQRHPETKSGVRVYEHGRYNLANKFIGRKKEMAELDNWLTDDSCPMFAVIALGGTGKSALTWHWLEKVKGMAEPPFNFIIWHGFYETGQVDTFLTDVLQFLGEKPNELGSKRVQLNRLLELLTTTPMLLVLDGAERLLRAYSGMNAAYQGDEEQTVSLARDCVDPVAADLLIGLSQLKNSSKTLLSSRLMPRELLGRGDKLPDTIARFDLTGLDSEDAFRFFTEWGIQTTRAEVNAVCAPLEYHPFCMALLAGYAAADFENPGDLRAAADYDPTHDLLGRRQHILQRAYNGLPRSAQITLDRLAAFRTPVSWETVESVFLSKPKQKWWQRLFGAGKLIQEIGFPIDKASLEDTLHLLEQRGLLKRSFSTAPMFDLHPITRRYAYGRLADRTAFHMQLINYYKTVSKAEKVNSIIDLWPTIELYHHLTRTERYNEAVILFSDQLVHPLFNQLGVYQQIIELLHTLFPEGEDKLPHLNDEAWQAWTLNELALNYSLSGWPRAAVRLFQKSNDIDEKRGAKKGMSISLGNLAYMALIPIGALAEAADNLRRSIELCHEIKGRLLEAIGRQERGRLLTYCGDWGKSASELDAALDLFITERDIQGQGVVRAHQTLYALIRGNSAVAQNTAQEAHKIAVQCQNERNRIQAEWLLGWVALTLGNYPESQADLDEALYRCRAINLVELEPAILLAQARLARAMGQTAISHNYVQQALTIAKRSGYILHLADIHNHLAHLALDANDLSTALTHAQTARDYAFCDGPPYAYQSALDEAERILAEL